MTLPIGLPRIATIGEFEQYNAAFCVVTFHKPLTAEQQAALITATRSFCNRSPGDELRTRFTLVFLCNKVTFWRQAATKAPTRHFFESLLHELGITAPQGPPMTMMASQAQNLSAAV